MVHNSTEIDTGTIMLGSRGDYRYLAFQPPLTDYELDFLTYPAAKDATDPQSIAAHSSIEICEDGSMEIGFDVDFFSVRAHDFSAYAEQVASYLGNRILDLTVREVSEGSIAAHAASTPKKLWAL